MTQNIPAWRQNVTIWATVPQEVHSWIEKINKARKDLSLSATVRYMLTRLKESVEKGDATDLIDELRRWST